MADLSADSVLFLALSMVLLASILYLPDHLVTISRRAYYYCAGDHNGPRQAAESLYGTATRAGDAMYDAATAWAHNAYQATLNKSATATVAAEAASQAAETVIGQLGVE